MLFRGFLFSELAFFSSKPEEVGHASCLHEVSCDIDCMPVPHLHEYLCFHLDKQLLSLMATSTRSMREPYSIVYHCLLMKVVIIASTVESVEDHTLLYLARIGNIMSYTIPSFP